MTKSHLHISFIIISNSPQINIVSSWIGFLSFTYKKDLTRLTHPFIAAFIGTGILFRPAPRVGSKLRIDAIGAVIRKISPGRSY